jgi:hypothetical protein
VAMTSRDRRALIVFGTVALAALVAYFLLLKPGSGGEEQPAAVGGPSVTKNSPAPAPSAGKKGKDHTPRRSRPPALPPVGGHDPFSPLVNVSAGGGTSPGTGSTSPAPSGGSTSPAPSGSTSSPPPVSPPGNPGSTPSGGTATKVGGHTVILIDVFTRSGEQRAQVSVDGDVSVVSEGQRFHGNFQLVSISGDCARMLFGDQSFILCENPQK